MQNYRNDDWMFLNCNSPADLAAEYGEEDVLLKEYDRCRNGHILVSDFFVESDDMEFTTTIKEFQDGAGAGLYFGDGCYNDYILAVVESNRVSVRIPSGVPLGDTFRYEGGKRYFELGEVQVKATLPLRLCIQKKGNKFSVKCNEKEVLCCEIKPVSGNKVQKEHARVMLQAVNSDTKSMVTACYENWQVSGRSESVLCEGTCIWENDKSPAANISLHLTGFRNQWVETDENGKFAFYDLPKGSYSCVAGCEKHDFWHFELIHDGDKKNYILCPEEKAQRESIPQQELQTDAATYPLNGIWRMDWDKEGIGEKERWFSKDHLFSRRIKVPFSWQSLAAFGEEFLADAYSLHQNCSWVTNAKEMGNTVWYQREICPEKTGRYAVVFAAISGFGTIWLNEQQIGHTTSSYEAFRFALGELNAGERYLLTVKVIYDFENDCYCQGKQGFWFTDAPGIWQNVWLEKEQGTRIRDILVDYAFVGESQNVEVTGKVYLETIEKGTKKDWKAELLYCSMEYRKIWLCTKNGGRYCLNLEPVGKNGYTNQKTAYFMRQDVSEEVWLEEDDGRPCTEELIKDIKIARVAIPDAVEIELGKQKKKVKPEITAEGELCASFDIEMADVNLWRPEMPFLYSLKADIYQYGKVISTAERKVGFRCVEAKEQKLWLNGTPFFVRGVLDQGYNPWGLYTYPYLRGKRPGSMEWDICKAREYGYNLIRMHIKDNEPDWYQLCDELGMMVWDEHPSNFYAVYGNSHWRNMYERQLRAMLRKQNYHPSIVIFSVFNESWGIMGDHEKSPWEIKEGQEWQKKETQFYKHKNPYVLAIDNSGYGKTGETDILDYHMYPDTYTKAVAFFRKMLSQNYVGSVFNCYNRENRQLMQDDAVRNLLQRTCRIDLKHAAFTGEECQKGQPVILSEFVHTNHIEQMVRILPGIAGYIRMNLSSQENEDTSPMLSVRTERNFGYLHEDGTSADYGIVNSENLLFPDYPPLTVQQAGSQVKVPVYISLWEPRLDGSKMQLRIVWKGTDRNGREGLPLQEREMTVRAKLCEPVKIWEEDVIIPHNMNGLHLYFGLYDEDRVCIAENYLQMEIHNGKKKDLVNSRKKGICSAAGPIFRETEGYSGVFCKKERELLWMSGRGSVQYHITADGCKPGRKFLQMEISTCECLEGTRITDDILHTGKIKMKVGEAIQEIVIPDAPCDRRALFSNASSAEGKEVSYKYTGKWGYGYQIQMPVDKKTLQEAYEKGFLEVTISCDEKGMIIYGNHMGRYGVNPMLLDSEI